MRIIQVHSGREISLHELAEILCKQNKSYLNLGCSDWDMVKSIVDGMYYILDSCGHYEFIPEGEYRIIEKDKEVET